MRTITELTAASCSAWDAYVQHSASGLPQHLSGWREVLYKTSGYETHYLLAQEEGHIVGVLPLFLVRSRLVGNTAMTMPGGLCADNQEVAAELIAHAREVAQQAKTRRLVLQDTRQLWNVPAAKSSQGGTSPKGEGGWPGGLQTTTSHVYWLVDVRMGSEALWQQLAGNVRRQVRLARRNQLTVTIDRTGRALGAFYDVFSRFTHQMGTPVFGRNFLEHIIETFPNSFNIAVVYTGTSPLERPRWNVPAGTSPKGEGERGKGKEQHPIGAYFQLQLGKTMYGIWGATLREYLDLRPVYLAYWELLCDAIANGCHFLDMGRSPLNSNASQYKGQWGGVSRPVYQQVVNLGQACRNGDTLAYWNAPAGGRVQIPQGDVPAEGKFQLMMRLWPKLPLPVAQYLGPKLRRHVPFA